MPNTKKFFVIYLCITSTVTLILLAVLLFKKPPGQEKTCPAPASQATCPQTEANAGINQLKEELKAVRGELAKMRADQRGSQTTLGAMDEEILEGLNLETILATPTGQISPVLGRLTLKISNTADIHQEKSASSTVIGQIYSGEKYPYFQKTGNWYLIKAQSVQGWVNASLVKEIN